MSSTRLHTWLSWTEKGVDDLTTILRHLPVTTQHSFTAITSDLLLQKTTYSCSCLLGQSTNSVGILDLTHITTV